MCSAQVNQLVFPFQPHLFPRLRSLAALLFLCVATLAGLEQWIAYRVGLIPGQYYQVLGDEDRESFQRVTAASMATILGMAATKALRVFASRSLTVAWRRTLTRALHARYFQGVRYYRLNVLGKN